MPDDDDVVGAVDAITGEKSVGRRLVREQPWRALALRCCANDDALCRCRAADGAVVAELLMDLSGREMAMGSRLLVVVRRCIV